MMRPDNISVSVQMATPSARTHAPAASNASRVNNSFALCLVSAWVTYFTYCYYIFYGCWEDVRYT